MTTQAEQNVISPWWGDPASGKAGVCPLYAPDTMGDDADVCTSCFHGPEAHAEAFVAMIAALQEAAELLDPNSDEDEYDPDLARDFLNAAIKRATGGES